METISGETMSNKSSTPYLKYTLLGGALVAAVSITAGCQAVASSQPLTDQSAELSSQTLEAQEHRTKLPQCDL